MFHIVCNVISLVHDMACLQMWLQLKCDFSVLSLVHNKKKSYL